jgi:non-specific serine/threonine protein kinase
MPEDLYDYQREDGNTVAQTDQNWILGHEMGVGKTPISLWAIKQNQYKLPLIICPNSLKYEWARQITEWTGKESAISRAHAQSRRLSDIVKALTNGGGQFHIINYETLRVEDVELLRLVPWDVIVFDEIHKLRNPHPSKIKKITKAVWDFLSYFPETKILGLSGSPIMNYPDDLYVPLSVCFPKQYPRTAASLRQWVYRYTLWNVGRYGSYSYGTRHLDELRRETKDLIIRRTKAEVLPFLPDKYYQRPELEMKEDQRKIYDDILNGLKILLDTGEPLWSPNVLSMMTRLRQINIDPKIVGVTSSSAKTEFLYDLIESTDEKLVIFSCFERYIYMLSEILKSWGKEYVMVTGEVPIEERARAVKRFQEDDKCQIFLGTIQCAGEGITLTASSTVILVDRWWNEPTNQQAVDRLHRIGQKSGVQVILPICKNSIDDTLDQILQRKSESTQAYYGESQVRSSMFSSLFG